jgi:LuxR family maltose regulon positive regulatory protein
MENSIKFISTKFNMPIPRNKYVKRKQLLGKLNEVFNNKITLVKGNAGSGKTTLVSSFIKENRLSKVVWITLDEDNNDIYSFWAYFLEGIKDYIIDDSKNILQYFEALIKENDIYDILTLLINNLCKSGEFIIVLDDFQYIKQKKLVDTLNYFIKYFPENIHVIIITRNEPRLHLSELLMKNKILRIEDSELKFSQDEERAFLSETVSMELDEEAMSKILKSTEGWIGGLQLITIAINKSNNKVIGNIRTLNKYMIDYLSREILESIQDDEKEFLIKTSMLSYFNMDIANKLLKIDNSNELINKLIDSDMFIVNIGGGKYRYHSIFKEFLKLQFCNLSYKERENFHLQAYKIYEDIGDLEESLSHLMIIKEYEKALLLIESIGQNPKGWTFLKKIPLEYIAKNRDMMFQRIFYYFCNMELSECKDVLYKLKNIVEDDFSTKILEFSIALVSNNFKDAIKVEPLKSEEIKNMNLSNVTKAIIHIISSMFLRLDDRYEEALQCNNYVLDIEKDMDNIYIRYFVLTFRAQLLEELGRLKDALLIYEKVFKMHEDFIVLASLKVNTYIAIAGTYIKMNKLDEAERYLEIAGKAIDTSNDELTFGYEYNIMELKILRGEKEQASQIIEKIFNLDEHLENSVYKFIIFKYLLYLQLLGEEQLKQAVMFYENNSSTKSRRLDDKIVYCRAQYMLGKINLALQIVYEVLKKAREEKLVMELIYASILNVVILLEDFNENKREILNHLREAIYYAADNQIFAPFIFEGKKLIEPLSILLLERYNNMSSDEKEFIRSVINAKTHNNEEGILSKREVDVITELSTGASNKEIGERLCISVSTVKTHIINIYSKLQVNNRIEAIEKARKVKIIK